MQAVRILNFLPAEFCDEERVNCVLYECFRVDNKSDYVIFLDITWSRKGFFVSANLRNYIPYLNLHNACLNHITKFTN